MRWHTVSTACPYVRYLTGPAPGLRRRCSRRRTSRWGCSGRVPQGTCCGGALKSRASACNSRGLVTTDMRDVHTHAGYLIHFLPHSGLSNVRGELNRSVIILPSSLDATPIFSAFRVSLPQVLMAIRLCAKCRGHNPMAARQPRVICTSCLAV